MRVMFHTSEKYKTIGHSCSGRILAVRVGVGGPDLTGQFGQQGQQQQPGDTGPHLTGQCGQQGQPGHLETLAPT